MKQFWIWAKVEAIDGAGDLFSGSELCAYFEKELWFELVNRMWRKHRSAIQYHVKYIHNDILNPFRVNIIQYKERFR